MRLSKWFNDSTESVVVYVFALVLVVQTIYPITIGDSAISYFIYNGMYSLLIISGVLVARNSPKLMRFVLIIGFIWFITGFVVPFIYNPEEINLGYFPGFVMIGLFQLVVMQVLFTYIFSAEIVSRGVLLAAISIYLLLGGFFGVLFAILEASTFLLTGQNAFIEGGIGVTGSITPWQTTLYYSYTTLTTLGYGDVLPVSAWARSLASVEAIVGVMYTTIIMARLVGVYVSDKDRKVIQGVSQTDQTRF
jgi:hypothetical protein